MGEKMETKTKGFTLIELVIVIAVLGILAGLAIPRYLDYLDESRKQVCVTNRAQLEREYAYYNAQGLVSSIKEFIDSTTINSNTVHDPIENMCPSKGTYSIGDNDHIVCSVHDKTADDKYGNKNYPGTGDYVPKTLYAVGTKVVGSDGIIYEATNASSASTYDPTTGYGLYGWKVVGTEDGQAISMPDSGSVMRKYEPGVVVLFKGEYWKNTNGTTSYSSPGTSGWEKLTK